MPMKLWSINLRQKLSLFDDHWHPRIIAEMDDYTLKLVKVKGEFVGHRHPDTDEPFICRGGELAAPIDQWV